MNLLTSTTVHLNYIHFLFHKKNNQILFLHHSIFFTWIFILLCVLLHFCSQNGCVQSSFPFNSHEKKIQNSLNKRMNRTMKQKKWTQKNKSKLNVAALSSRAVLCFLCFLKELKLQRGHMQTHHIYDGFDGIFRFHLNGRDMKIKSNFNIQIYAIFFFTEMYDETKTA